MYYMFGFLFLVFIILLITCSEATVLLCYFHLCAEVNRHLLSLPRPVYCWMDWPAGGSKELSHICKLPVVQHWAILERFVEPVLPAVQKFTALIEKCVMLCLKRQDGPFYVISSLVVASCWREHFCMLAEDQDAKRGRETEIFSLCHCQWNRLWLFQSLINFSLYHQDAVVSVYQLEQLKKKHTQGGLLAEFAIFVSEFQSWIPSWKWLIVEGWVRVSQLTELLRKQEANLCARFGVWRILAIP